MQTFLAYDDVTESARILDYRRLGKQRPEALTIINTLSGKSSGWAHHPAVKMWAGYEEFLKLYYNAILLEWIERKYNNSMDFMEINPSKIIKPHWFGDKAFHASHRSNLLRKDFGYYSQFGWTEPDDLPYVWPEGANAR